MLVYFRKDAAKMNAHVGEEIMVSLTSPKESEIGVLMAAALDEYYTRVEWYWSGGTGGKNKPHPVTYGLPGACATRTSIIIASSSLCLDPLPNAPSSFPFPIK